MPFLGAVFAALGSAFGAVATALGGVKVLLGILLNVALTLLQYLMAPRPPKPDDMQQVIRQSTPDRNVHLGRVRTGGPLLMAEVKNRIIYLIVYFSQGQVDAYEEWIIDQRPVVVDNDGYVRREKNRQYPTDKAPVFYIDSRKGLAQETAYKVLLNDLGTFITKDFRGDRLATGLLMARSVGSKYVQQYFPNGIPVLNVIGRFGLPYDPRDGASRWTDNLAIHLHEYLTTRDGLGIDRDLMGETWKRAAVTANQLVPTKAGGSVRRYGGSTTWKLNEKPGDVITRCLIPMDGRLYLGPSGKVEFKVGEWEEPTVHILDHHILNASLRRGSTPIQEAGEVVVRWTNPNASYTPATSQPWRDEAVIKRAGGNASRVTADCYSIQNHNHARRIAKILSRRSNPEWQGRLTTTLFGMNAWDQRFIRISFADAGIVSQTFEVLAIGLDEANLTVELRVQSVDASMYEFDPLTEEGTAPVDPESLGEDNISAPEGFAVSAFVDATGVTLQMSVEKPPKVGGSTEEQEKLYIYKTAIKPLEEEENDDDGEDEEEEDEDAIYTQFQWARANTGIWRNVGETGPNITAEVNGIKNVRRLDIRARHLGADGTPSPWVEIEDIEPASEYVRPQRPIGVRVRAEGVGVARVSWKTPDDVNFAGVRIYRNTTNNASTAELIDTVYGAIDANYFIDDETDPGTYYYWVSSINWRGLKQDETVRVAATGNPITI